MFHVQGSRQAWSFCCCSHRKELPRHHLKVQTRKGLVRIGTSVFTDPTHRHQENTYLVLMQSLYCGSLNAPGSRAQWSTSPRGCRGLLPIGQVPAKMQERNLRVLSSSWTLLTLLPSFSSSWTSHQTSPCAPRWHQADGPAVPGGSPSPQVGCPHGLSLTMWQLRAFSQTG